ncbi:MAG: serine/threonine-protein kinase [Candidatus Hydrogenedentes bacterium]|nr:serine/threonine-protein kinase [Candidatus Hydrogenedentota bacterium]
MIMQRERRLSWDRALDIASQIADALVCAHQAQIIHRDIKPGNILLDKNNRVFVTDFGIAKILTAETQLTADGSLLGTPQYMAPERCQNGEATAASDIYSLGILTFQMISGRLPFEALTPVDLVRKIVSEPPVRLRDLKIDVPEDVDRLVAFMMEKKPKDRPPNSRALCEAIARVRFGEPLDTHGGEVAAALASFRDSISTPTPHPGAAFTTQSATTEERIPVSSRRARGWWRRAGSWRRTAIGICMLAALSAAGFSAWLFWGARNAPALDITNSADHGASRWAMKDAVAKFTDEAPGVVLAHLNMDGFAPVEQAPCGETQTIVQLTGLRNGARDGQSALVSIDPSRRTALLELGPVGRRNAAGTRGTITCLAGVGAVPASSPLNHSAILWYPFETGKETRGEYLAAWNVQSQAPTYPIFQSQNLTSDPRSISAASPKADGATIALALMTSDGACFLAERDTRQKDISAYGPTLAEPGAPIVTVVYSPDGTQIAFVRKLSGVRQQVWLLPVAAPDKKRALAEGDVHIGPHAFSPDGTLLLIAERRSNGRSEMRLVRVEDGSTSAELGDGWMGGWGVKSDNVIVAAPDVKGTCQLWAISVGGAMARTQLTFLDAGVAHEFCISGDGTWAASSMGAANKADLVFVHLAKTEL